MEIPFEKTMWLSVVLYNTVIITQTLVVFGSTSECYETESLDLLKTRCHYKVSPNNETCDDCKASLRRPEIYIKDVKTGIINVELNLYPSCCNYTRYDLRLEIKNIKANDTCENKVRGFKIHSDRHLEIHYTTENSNMKSCEQKTNVTFENVYTGCYCLDITPQPGDMIGFPYCKFIKTEYTKKDIATSPTITPKVNLNCERKDFEFTIGGLHKLNVSKLQVEYRKCSKDSYNCEVCPLSLKWSIEIDWNKSGGPVCQKEVVGVATTCTLRDLNLECTVHNISTGSSYCVFIHMEGDRCEGGTVWSRNGNNCNSMTNIINATPDFSCTPEQNTISTSTSMILLAAGAGIGVLFVISVCLMIYFYRKKTHPSTKKLQDTRPEVKKPKMLLLYPHDCEEFMDLITYFRILLEEYIKCEVFDCFDNRHAESIGKSKVDWIRQHIMNTEEKVVVVETQCAVLHQEALMNNSKITYSKPHWLDDLFIYGLKALTEDITNNTYERVYVVRVEGFTGDKDVLNHLSPFTRFVLPQHLTVLMSHLFQYQNEHRVTLSGGTDNRLEEMIKQLQCYKEDNPEYLSELIQTVVC